MTAAARTARFWRTLVLTAILFPGLATAQSSPATPKITEEQAKAAALKAVPGRVTSVVIEKKGSKHVYVVEIAPRGGGEKDVHIDLDTGQVLRVED